MVERELEAWFRVGLGQDAWDAFAAEFGQKSLYLGDTGAEYTWSRGALTGEAQLSGAVVATRGLAADIYTALGARVRPLAPGVLNPGDAGLAEPGPIADLATLGGLGFTHLNMVTPTRPSSALSLTFSKARWDGLSNTQRTLIEAAAMAQSHVIAAQGMKRNAVAKQIFRLTSAVDVAEAPLTLFTAMMDASRDRFDALEQQDTLTRGLLGDYRRFGTAVQSWTRVADAPFTSARARTAAQNG
jgi:TRAP-type mannitol/chloroaromatic compound transport system substrate-binding protein